MSEAPVVGITLRTLSELSSPYWGRNQSYFAAVATAGGIPVGIAPLHDEQQLRHLYERCDAILFPGGPDLDPARYGQQPDPHSDIGRDAPVDAALDEAELRLASWVIEDDRPALGICRGLQLLNVACGGSLWQDLEHQAGLHGHDRHELERSHLAHDVQVDQGRLAGILGRVSVPSNSLHHQGIRDLAAPLQATAHAPDGLIEGVELPGHRFLVAVQPHPEELTGRQEWADRLFRAFIIAAR